MRIIYVSNSVIPSRTANSIHVMNMCSALSNRGHEVVLIAPRAPSSYERDVTDVFGFYGVQETFKIRRLWWPRFKGSRYVYALLVAIESLRWHPDLVLGRYVLGLALSALIGRRVVLDMHGPFTSTVTVDQWCFHLLARSRNLLHVTTNSRALARRVGPLFPKKEVRVAHNGASLDSGRGINVQDGRNQRGGTPTSDHRAGYLGHLYQGRGVELILQLAEQLPDWRFILVGGTEEDLQRWRGSSIPPNVEVRGFIRPADIRGVCLDMDVLLMPYQRRVAVHGGAGNSAEWMCPLKMFEYMAAGKAILSSDLPVLHEVLTHEKNALLVPPDDPGAWVCALRRLGEEPSLRRTLGRNARRELELKYTWDRRAARVLEGVEEED